MPRKYKKKSNRGEGDPSAYRAALELIITDNVSISNAALKLNVPRKTLNVKFLELKKICNGQPKLDKIEKLSFGYKKPQQVNITL